MAVSQLSAESCSTRGKAAPTRELDCNLANRRLDHSPRYGNLATGPAPPREPRIAMSRTGTGSPIQQARNERR